MAQLRFMPISEEERAIIRRLLEVDFPGCDRFRLQVDGLLAVPCTICNFNFCRSLEFSANFASDRALAPEHVLPVRGYHDSDLHLLLTLWQREEALSLLEVVSLEGRSPVRLPPANEVEVVRVDW
jgi:hypothetical protein